MSISTSQLYDWLRYAETEVRTWIDQYGEPPAYIFLSSNLSLKLKESPAIWMRYADAAGMVSMNVFHHGKTHNIRMSHVLGLELVDKNLHVVVGNNIDMIADYVAERELLCATTGVSIADTVTTSEKTKSEE